MATDNTNAMISVKTKRRDAYHATVWNIYRRCGLHSWLDVHLPDVKPACGLDNTIPLRYWSKLLSIGLFSFYVLSSDNSRSPPSISTDTNARLTYCRAPENCTKQKPGSCFIHHVIRLLLFFHKFCLVCNRQVYLPSFSAMILTEWDLSEYASGTVSQSLSPRVHQPRGWTGSYSLM